MCVCILEPVGEVHHDIEGPQEEDTVEVGVAVDCPVLLVIHHILAPTPPLLIIVLVV